MSKSDTFFLIVLATLPLQLNKFFFPDYSFVLGIPIDYRAITIYLSDLALVAYLLFFLIENGKNLKKIYQDRKHLLVTFLLLNLYLFISSTFFSVSTQASIWSNLKFLQFCLFALFASATLSRKQILKPLNLVLTFSIFWQALLVVTQFILQKSTGLWILGERSFDVSTISIAHLQIFGSQLLRPYGTFPHPNVAAAFFLIYLIILTPSIFSSSIFKNRPQILSVSFSALAILMIFSKAAFLALAIVFLTLAKTQKQFVLRVVLLVILISILLKFLPPSQLSTIAERITLAQAALDISLKNPLFGIGSDNFILGLSQLNLPSINQIRLLQPVHNVFMLILAENGLIGLLLFVTLLLIVARSINSKTKAALFVSVLVLGSFDHFLWTLHQGQLLFWLTLAYILSRPPSKSLAR